MNGVRHGTKRGKLKPKEKQNWAPVGQEAMELIERFSKTQETWGNVASAWQRRRSHEKATTALHSLHVFFVDQQLTSPVRRKAKGLSQSHYRRTALVLAVKGRTVLGLRSTRLVRTDF